MRKLVFCVFAFILPVLSLLGTNYYSGNAGALNSLNPWWTNRDGTGDHPPSFLNSNQVSMYKVDRIRLPVVPGLSGERIPK